MAREVDRSTVSNRSGNADYSSPDIIVRRFLFYILKLKGGNRMFVLANVTIDMSSMFPYLSWFWDGTKITLIISFITVIFGCIFGFVATLGKRSRFKLINFIASAYTQVIRGTPLLLQLYIFMIGLPAIGINISDVFGITRSGTYILCLIALSINSGAYICEIFRSGLNSVDVGQTEAARSLGLNSRQTMRYVILPQAIKTILPSLGNEFITMIKESSLVSTFGLADLMYQQKIIQGATYRVLEPMIMIGIAYFIITMVLTSCLSAFERRLNRDAKN